MRWVIAVCVAAVVLSGGCGKRAETSDELSAAISAGAAVAQNSQSKRDYESAEKAASRAEDAVERLRKLATGDAHASQLLVEADAAARRARHFADLADEEHRLEGRLNGLAARSYRTARRVAFATMFKGMALAAEQAGKGQFNGLPQGVRDAANEAAAYAGDFAGRVPLADGSPDWAGIVKDMNGMAAKPPSELAASLCLGYMIMGQWQLALYEIDGVDPNHIPVPRGVRASPQECHIVYHIGRGLAYRANGFSHMAMREFRSLASEGTGKPEMETDEGLMGTAHFVSALAFLQAGEYRQGDLEMAEAIRAEPNGPLAWILTGERLAAGGDYPEAVKSLEGVMSYIGKDDPWLAERIGDRVREIRDKKGDAEPLVCDADFLCRIIMHYIGEAARESETAGKLKEYVDSSASLGRKVVGLLPGASRQAEPNLPAR
jgi:hypothetical protein